MLTHIQWKKIDEAIQIIHSISDENIMAECFLDALNLLVSYDYAMFYFINRDGLITKDPVLKEFTIEDFNKYLDIINNNANSRIATSFRKTITYRDSTYLDNPKTNNNVYTKLLVLKNIEYGGGIVITNNHQIIAEVIFYRNNLNKDYSDEELEILNILKEHLHIRLTKKTIDYSSINQLSIHFDLTKREAEIVNYILSDYNNEEIAKELNISFHTVKKHIQNIYSKLEINNRIQLIKIVNNFLD